MGPEDSPPLSISWATRIHLNCILRYVLPSTWETTFHTQTNQQPKLYSCTYFKLHIFNRKREDIRYGPNCTRVSINSIWSWSLSHLRQIQYLLHAVILSRILFMRHEHKTSFLRIYFHINFLNGDEQIYCVCIQTPSKYTRSSCTPFNFHQFRISQALQLATWKATAIKHPHNAHHSEQKTYKIAYATRLS